MSQARGQGFSERTLRRAKKELGAVANRGEDGKTWWWEMPERENTDPEKAAN